MANEEQLKIYGQLLLFPAPPVGAQHFHKEISQIS